LHPTSRDGQREGYYLVLDSGGLERTAPPLDLTLLLGPDDASAAVIETTSARADYRIALG
jgi:hypothetical protein